MTIDISIFITINIIDSCAIWNVLSSRVLHTAAVNSRCAFDITRYVEYECLHKSRSVVKESDTKIKNVFLRERTKGLFQTHNLSIDDLQEITTYGNTRSLGMGELSSIAFAKKINQAFMSDDQKARKLAEKILGRSKVQTTPHLVGWLVFTNNLNDTDIANLVAEHKANHRPLEKYFKEAYEEALRIKCLTMKSN